MLTNYYTNLCLFTSWLVIQVLYPLITLTICLITSWLVKIGLSIFGPLCYSNLHNLPLKVYTGSCIVLSPQWPVVPWCNICRWTQWTLNTYHLWYLNSSLHHNLLGHTPYPCGILVVVVSQGVLYVNKLQSWVLSLASNCGDQILPYSCSFTLVASVKAFRLHNSQC